MTGESDQLATAAGLPPMAVPITVKIPEPITAPIPSAVSETGPSVFLSACSGRSESLISLSIDLVAKICLASARSWSVAVFHLPLRNTPCTRSYGRGKGSGWSQPGRDQSSA